MKIGFHLGIPMEIICISKRLPGSDATRLAELATAEAQAVWELYEQQIVRGVYFDPEKPAGIICLEAPDKNEAQRLLQKLPMVAEGLIDFDIYALGPFHQFSLLFAR
jgi:hypothetical protein